MNKINKGGHFSVPKRGQNSMTIDIEKIGINLMPLRRKTQSPSGLDCFYPENPHQTPGLVSTNFKSSPLQLPAYHPAAIYGKVQVNFIHFLKNQLIFLLAESDSFVIERGPIQRNELALPPKTQFLVLPFHQLFL